MCAASCGPGNTHLINGLFDANRSRVPVLVIAAQIPRPEIGSGYFQETHPQELFRECSVYCELVSTAEQLPRVLRIAMRTAVSRRGVAVVVVPGDVLLETDRGTEPVSAIRRTTTVSRPGDDELAAAAALLNAAERVTILAGAGCAGAHAELMEAARVLQAPIVHTLRGKEHVEYDNPFDVGLTGLLGFASGYRAMESCDALLVLGADFPYRDFYPERRAGGPGRCPRRADRPALARRVPAGRDRQGHARGAAAAAERQGRQRAQPPRPDAPALRAHPPGPRQARHAPTTTGRRCTPSTSPSR